MWQRKGVVWDNSNGYARIRQWGCSWKGSTLLLFHFGRALWFSHSWFWQFHSFLVCLLIQCCSQCLKGINLYFLVKWMNVEFSQFSVTNNEIQFNAGKINIFACFECFFAHVLVFRKTWRLWIFLNSILTIFNVTQTPDAWKYIKGVKRWILRP